MIKVLLKPPSLHHWVSMRMIKVLLKPPSLHHWVSVRMIKVLLKPPSLHHCLLWSLKRLLAFVAATTAALSGLAARRLPNTLRWS